MTTSKGVRSHLKAITIQQCEFPPLLDTYSKAAAATAKHQGAGERDDHCRPMVPPDWQGGRRCKNQNLLMLFFFFKGLTQFSFLFDKTGRKGKKKERKKWKNDLPGK